MKRWQVIAAILFPLLLTISLAAVARAQGWEQAPTQLAAVISKAAVLADGLLGHWVSGANLTSPAGEQLVAALAHAAVYTVHFFAELATM